MFQIYFITSVAACYQGNYADISPAIVHLRSTLAKHELQDRYLQYKLLISKILSQDGFNIDSLGIKDVRYEFVYLFLLNFL
jgi:hypothetical protein